MKQDLVGRLERWHLSMRNSLYPLFEAVSNSIQAVEATKRTDGFVHIDLRRSSSQTTLDLNDESTEKSKGVKSGVS